MRAALNLRLSLDWGLRAKPRNSCRTVFQKLSSSMALLVGGPGRTRGLGSVDIVAVLPSAQLVVGLDMFLTRTLRRGFCGCPFRAPGRAATALLTPARRCRRAFRVETASGIARGLARRSRCVGAPSEAHLPPCPSPCSRHCPRLVLVCVPGSTQDRSDERESRFDVSLRTVRAFARRGVPVTWAVP